jgi:hypothetical protein
MNLTAILATISLAFGMAGGFYTAWEIQGSKIDNLKATYDTARMDSERTAFRQSEKSSARLSAAQSQAAARIRANSVAAAGASSAGFGLRQSSDTAMRGAQGSLAACLATAAKLDYSIREVVDFAEQTSAEHGLWESSAIEHHEAWPQ